jgi:2-keto-3-deoxy-L-rhamnonate aldolase RhmA
MTISFKKKLAEGRPLIGTIMTLPSPEIAEVCADAGFDWLFVDMEHGLLGLADVQRIVQAVGGRCPCLIRVPTNEPVSISKALDTGAAGLIFPHINGAEEARAAVRAAKYPPEGTRSIGIARAQGYGTRLMESLENANQEIVLIAQAEHIDAARRIEAIIAERGIDGVFIGPFDLSGSLGRPGRIADPEVQEAIKAIRDSCVKSRVSVGILARNAEAAKDFIAKGYRLLGDIARRIVRELRAP